MSDVAVGAYTLEIGGPGGTLIQDADTTADAAKLSAALRDATPWEAPLEKSERGTDRVEKTAALYEKLTDGKLLELGEIEQWIKPALDRIAQLDRDGHFDEALELARAAQRACALTRRWIDLIRMLLGLLHRARKRADQATTAWAQHELGTLHLAAGNAAEADKRLTEALKLRRELTDHAALAATEQSLRALCRRLREELREKTAERPRLRRLAMASIAVLLLALGGVAGATLPSGAQEPTPTPTATPTPTPPRTPTPSPSPSPTPTPSRTPSPTPSPSRTPSPSPTPTPTPSPTPTPTPTPSPTPTPTPTPTPDPGSRPPRVN